MMSRPWLHYMMWQKRHCTHNLGRWSAGFHREITLYCLGGPRSLCQPFKAGRERRRNQIDATEGKLEKAWMHYRWLEDEGGHVSRKWDHSRTTSRSWILSTTWSEAGCGIFLRASRQERGWPSADFGLGGAEPLCAGNSDLCEILNGWWVFFKIIFLVDLLKSLSLIKVVSAREWMHK